MKKSFYCTLFVIGITSYSQAQMTAPSVWATAGGHGSSASHQLSWTVGEPVTTSLSSGSITLTQGFHQPNLVVNSLFKVNKTIQLNAFPNPTSQSITIELGDDIETEDLTLSLYNITGQQLEERILLADSNIQELSLENYPSGIYLIHLKNVERQLLTTYQIIKK